MTVTVRARPDSPRQCPFCRDEAGEGVAPCACGVIYHPECRAELSRCVTIGCAGKSAAPGLRVTHRDVACVGCQGLINNDGDMCFVCWSPLHRRCLAGGCSACSPTPAAAEDGPSVGGLLSATFVYLGIPGVTYLIYGGFWRESPFHLIGVSCLTGTLVAWVLRLLLRSRKP